MNKNHYVGVNIFPVDDNDQGVVAFMDQSNLFVAKARIQELQPKDSAYSFDVLVPDKNRQVKSISLKENLSLEEILKFAVNSAAELLGEKSDSLRKDAGMSAFLPGAEKAIPESISTQSSSPVEYEEVAPERRNELADQVYSLARRSPQLLETKMERTKPNEHTVLTFIAKYHLTDGEKRLDLTLYDYPPGIAYEDQGKTRVYLDPIEWNGKKSTLVMLLPGNLVLTRENPLAILYQMEKNIRRLDLGTHIAVFSASSPMLAKELKDQITKYRKIMADTTQGDLERANAIENLESTLAIIRRDIFLVEDQLNQGGPVDSQRIREIDGLIGNLRSGNLKDFHLKGESVDVLNFKKEKTSHDRCFKKGGIRRR